MYFAKQNAQLSVTRSSHVKTPIQEYGWEYIKRQKASGRPLSPHLAVYKKQLTWMLSGLYRVSGTIMGGTLLVGSVGFMVLPIDFTTFVGLMRDYLPFFIKDAIKFIIAFPMIYYVLNEIRFLGFEMAIGTDIVSVYRSGWFVLGTAIVLTLLVIINAKRTKDPAVLAANPKSK